MGFLEAGAAATDEKFNLRIQAALFKIAQDIMSESPDTDNHQERLQYSLDFFVNPDVRTRVFSWLCASNPTINATITLTDSQVQIEASDNDIEYVCVSNFEHVRDWTTGRIL